jgi:hypothetical protein
MYTLVGTDAEELTVDVICYLNIVVKRFLNGKFNQKQVCQKYNRDDMKNYGAFYSVLGWLKY